jgi:hypothetical protein
VFAGGTQPKKIDDARRTITARFFISPYITPKYSSEFFPCVPWFGLAAEITTEHTERKGKITAAEAN